MGQGSKNSRKPKQIRTTIGPNQTSREEVPKQEPRHEKKTGFRSAFTVSATSTHAPPPIYKQVQPAAEAHTKNLEVGNQDGLKTSHAIRQLRWLEDITRNWATRHLIRKATSSRFTLRPTKSCQSTLNAWRSHAQLLQSTSEEVTPKHFWPMEVLRNI